MFLINSVLMV